MSIVSVDNISPIGSGTSVTVNSAATLVLNNVNSTGVITATSFVGSGANLTSLPAANLTGALPAISGANLTGLPAGTTINGNTDHYVVTATGTANTLQGESTLLFNNGRLDVTQTTSSSDAKVVIRNSNTPGSGSLRLEFQYGTGTTEGTNRFRFGYVEGYRAGGSNDGGLKFGTKPGNADAPTERLRINPKGQISIRGTTTAFDTTGDLDSLQLYYETDSGQASIGPYSSGGNTHLSFYTNAGGAAAVERLRIASDGKVDVIGGYVARNPTDSFTLNGVNQPHYGFNLNANSTVPVGFSGYYGIAFATTGVERLRINKTTGDLQLNNYSGNAGRGRILFGSSAPAFIEGYDTGNAGSGAYLKFGTNGTDRMRIDNSGHTFFSGMDNLTASGSNKGINMENSSNNGRMNIHANSSAGNALGISFYNNGNNVGTIYYGTSSTAYNTSSDYRLKENEVPISDGITRLKSLKPYRFNFKVDPDKTVDGFFAHEVAPVIPEAVTGEKDAEDMQQIDQAKLVPLLTAVLQEAITKIETLEQENIALRARVTNLEGE